MNRTRILVEVAILVAMAFVLEVAFSFLPAMPQGGRVGISMLPLIVIAWRHGVGFGVIGGVVYGLLNMMLDGILYHWASFFLDYTIAFGVIGIVGVSKQLLGDNIVAFGISIIFAFVFRFFSHLLSGALLFGSWAPEGQGVWEYSAIYNISYLLPAMILTFIVGLGIFYPLRLMERDV